MSLLGEYVFEGHNVENLTPDEQAEIEGKIDLCFNPIICFLRMSALKQVGLPLMYQGVRKSERDRRATIALEAVGLKDKNAKSSGMNFREVNNNVSLSHEQWWPIPLLFWQMSQLGAPRFSNGKEVLDIFTKLNEQGKTVIIIRMSEKLQNMLGK